MKAKPGVTPIGQWPPVNQNTYRAFLVWLEEGGYSGSALTLYAIAARLAFGTLNKEYWLIDPEADLAVVDAYLVEHYPMPATRQTYQKGLRKLAEYLRLRCPPVLPGRRVNWAYHLAPLPAWLAAQVRSYLTHCQRAWPVEVQAERTVDTLSHVTQYLRWAVAQAPLTTAADFTPALWFAYLDSRLAAGIRPTTLNGQLSSLHAFLTFLKEQDVAICARMLQVEGLAPGTHLPRDVPPEQISLLLAEITRTAQATHAGVRRMGLLDRTWFLLMLHSGLRTGEVRRLRNADCDLTRQVLRIEQSKGLKDRLVYISQTAVDALTAYLPMRGPAVDDHVFLYRHQPLTATYCSERLLTYAERCGVRVTPHQLRHTCATLLLNAGAPILTVQAILGHRHIDTTLGYARLYDGTIAADYYRAMAQVEDRMTLQNTAPDPGAFDIPQMSALIDIAASGTLTYAQRQALNELRGAIMQMLGTNSSVRQH